VSGRERAVETDEDELCIPDSQHTYWRSFPYATHSHREPTPDIRSRRLYVAGEVISTEMRALNNLNWYRGVEAPHSFIGLTGYGPNINIARDPRFGRISELPGEGKASRARP
jgi:hypothetical protein